MSTETRGRLRFKDFSIERLSSGQCQARVVLAWPGEATGLSSQAGQLRWAAQACLSALATAFPEVAFDLVGLKAVRAFDATVVIASLATQGRLDGPRVVGSALVQDQVPRGAALAVLNATNRLMTGSSEARR